MATQNAIDTDIPIGVAKGGTGAVSLTDGGIMLGSGTGAVTVLGQALNGQLPIGSTGADAVLATLTEGSNITITEGAGTITIAASGGSGLTWNEETGTSVTMAIDNGYIANNASLVTLTLPTTAPIGSIVRIVGKGAGGWKIAQNASENIRWDEASITTTGVGGSLASTDDFDMVELVCMTADTNWVLLTAKGNVTIV